MQLKISVPPLLAGGKTVPEDVQALLVAALYGQSGSLTAGLLALAMTGCSVAWGLGQPWPLWGVAASIPVFIYRYWLMFYFRHHAQGNWRAWTYAFTCGAWVTATLWAAAGVFAIQSEDCFVRYMILTVEATFIIAAMARNNASPATAVGIVAITVLPLIVAASICNTTVAWICAGYALINALAAVTTVRHRANQTLRLLLADRIQTQLLERLETANRQLATISSTDALTRLLNRRGFDQALAESWDRCRESSSPLSVLMVDVDLFKQFNDRYGHIMGDDCLRRTAAAVAGAVRKHIDIPARYGGEEFSVILPATTGHEARVIAERVRFEVEAMAIPHQDSPYGYVSVSVGIGWVVPSSNASTSDLLVEADRSLYSAKGLGRNKLGAMMPSAALQ